MVTCPHHGPSKKAPSRVEGRKLLYFISGHSLVRVCACNHLPPLWHCGLQATSSGRDEARTLGAQDTAGPSVNLFPAIHSAPAPLPVHRGSLSRAGVQGHQKEAGGSVAEATAVAWGDTSGTHVAPGGGKG